MPAIIDADGRYSTSGPYTFIDADGNRVTVQGGAQQDTGRHDVASATDFAIFRSRVAVLITRANVVVASAASKAGVVLSFLRGGSAASTVTLSSATSAGMATSIALGLTIHSLGELFSMRHDDIGDYHVVYEYRVL